MNKTATKKPVTIEFIEWTGDNFDEVKFFCGDKVQMIGTCEIGCQLVINSMEGDHISPIGSMIIKGVKGEFYFCKPDIFELTYDIN